MHGISDRVRYRAGKYEIIPEQKSRIPALTAGALVVFLLLTHLFWPAGDAAIRDFLIPGEDAVTLRAAKTLVENLKEGTALGEAAEAFCREILTGAQLQN